MSLPGFNNSFGSGQPYRRRAAFRVSYDADGKVVLHSRDGQADIISPDDSLDKIELDIDDFLDGCGCNAKTNRAGAHCGEPGCARVVCEKHLRHCENCSKPLCLQHLYYFQAFSDQRIPLCPNHYREAVRRRWWQRIAKTALRPFVAFDHRNSPK
jgi:hypothetical protein